MGETLGVCGVVDVFGFVSDFFTPLLTCHANSNLIQIQKATILLLRPFLTTMDVY